MFGQQLTLPTPEATSKVTTAALKVSSHQHIIIIVVVVVGIVRVVCLCLGALLPFHHISLSNDRSIEAVATNPTTPGEKLNTHQSLTSLTHITPHNVRTQSTRPHGSRRHCSVRTCIGMVEVRSRQSPRQGRRGPHKSPRPQRPVGP